MGKWTGFFLVGAIFAVAASPYPFGVTLIQAGKLKTVS
jgi:hypothetical protein